MKKSWKKKILLIGALLLLLLAGGCFWYVNDYYKSDETVAAYLEPDTQVEVEEIREGLFLNGPGEDEALIFYPGAKVEYTAYVPLLYGLAERGMDVFLVKMPCNLAFLGKNKADTIREQYTYEDWYLGGHSLGGAMAASYSAAHLQELRGLVLLAAYPTESLQADGFSVLSLYGSEDGVLNLEKLEAGRAYMPEDYTEICLEGGNHAGFGNYGAQEGDEDASITREEQQRRTVEAIWQMVQE